jgi:V8-like Glu-specific endopeptidase
MKRLILYLSFLLCVPCVAFGADYCTDPDKYTIDKRCYVTDEQKKETPYKAVVMVLGSSGNVRCTGTIAKWNRGLTNKDFSGLDDLLYLFTAKHCTDNIVEGVPDRQLRIKLQNGDKIDVRLVGTGDYNLKEEYNFDGDWAVYRLPIDLIKDAAGQYHVNMISAENMKDKIPWVYADADGQQDGRVVNSVGYGALKIMSDKEIEIFKKRYLGYLKNKGITVTDENVLDYGLIDNDAVDYFNDNVFGFINSFIRSSYNNVMFNNDELKISNCLFSSDGGKCQGWGGNSGGPVFDDDNRLVGVHTRGYYLVGGERHGRSSKDVTVGNIYRGMNRLTYIDKQNK